MIDKVGTMILKAGDRICHINGDNFGTVVSGGRFGKESDVPVKWDSVPYDEELPYSLPRAKYIRLLTPLEQLI